eukprot:830965-Rhodomonas_salina.1
MEEVYTAVQKIRQSKALAAQTRGGRRSNSPRKYRKELRKLTGTDRQRAFDKGLCLGCGKS